MPKVLIAEPDEQVRTVLRESFRASHWTFVEATTGDETIALARGAKPDIVLIEPSLPGDGIAVLRHLRAEPATRHLPFVVLTGFFHAEWARDLWRLSPGRILLKPMYPSEILAELQVALSGATLLPSRCDAPSATVVGDLRGFVDGHAALVEEHVNGNGHAVSANGNHVLQHDVARTDLWRRVRFPE